MVLIGVKVGGDDDTIAEPPSSQSLLRLLTVCRRVELYEYLPTSRHVHPLDRARYLQRSADFD